MPQCIAFFCCMKYDQFSSQEMSIYSFAQTFSFSYCSQQRVIAAWSCTETSGRVCCRKFWRNSSPALHSPACLLQSLRNVMWPTAQVLAIGRLWEVSGRSGSGPSSRKARSSNRMFEEEVVENLPEGPGRPRNCRNDRINCSWRSALSTRIIDGPISSNKTCMETERDLSINATLITSYKYFS